MHEFSLHLYLLPSVHTSAHGQQPKLLMLRLFDASDSKPNKLPIHAPQRGFLCSHLSRNAPFSACSQHPPHTHTHTQKRKKESQISVFHRKKNVHGHISLPPKECHLTSCIWDRIPPPEKSKRARVCVRERDMCARASEICLCVLGYFSLSLYSPTCPLDPESRAGVVVGGG